MSMTVAQVVAALNKVEDQQRELVVCIGNPLIDEDFSIEEVYDKNFPANEVALMVFAEGKYNFGQFDRGQLYGLNEVCENCSQPHPKLQTWRTMLVCPQCKTDLIRDEGPDMEDVLTATEAREDR